MNTSLEQDGIIYGLAQACVEAARAIADRATPEGVIEGAVQIIHDDDPERVAQCLQRVLAGLRMSLGETGTVKVDLL